MPDNATNATNTNNLDTYDKYFKDVDHYQSRHPSHRHNHRTGRDDGNVTLEELNARRKSLRPENDEAKVLDDLLIKDKDGKYVNFDKADTDKNGKLSKGEFLQYLSEKNGGSDQPDGKFDEILTDFNKIDGKNRKKKRNGQIERNEFSAYELEKFNEADKDHNGKLSQEELKTLDPNADFSKYDKNTDKQIDKNEFNKYINDQFDEIDKLGKKDNRITVGEWIAHRIDHTPPPPPPTPDPGLREILRTLFENVFGKPEKGSMLDKLIDVFVDFFLGILNKKSDEPTTAAASNTATGSSATGAGES